MMKRAVLGIALGLALATPAAAAPRCRSIDGRQHRQHARIHQGVVSGALTPREVRALASEQAAIRAEEFLYRRNGLSPWERHDLQRDLNRASRHIYIQKHDPQRR